MPAVAMQTQSVAPHQLHGHTALSSPSHHSLADALKNPQARRVLIELVEMLLQAALQKLKEQEGAESTGDDNAFLGSKPTGYNGPQGGGEPQSAGAPQGTGAPQGAGVPQGTGMQGSGEGAAQDADPLEVPTTGAPPQPVSKLQQAAPATATAGTGKAPAGMPAAQWQGCVEAGKKTGIDPYILAAQAKQESQFGTKLAGSDSAGDGVMQIEPGTRQDYAAKFQAKMGHAYDHSNVKDQIALAGVILADHGGSATNMLQKYNGGPNWKPGATDIYGRVIHPEEYAAKVLASAREMKSSAGG
ncbi:transglycosylase SLT domain-containing protein [Variovorax sp. 770b2]|uniref:transglycosylase SLT domain-containing protein n=1 Tax=Variovorax sp. 770b2 TaxID=1566271 RepID=UPI0008E1DEAA|nr:transglycosylase SLT domain-containing protein [Variovorax sp. 770b2]SFQ03995.1 Transglycosylase SLT domain-containing protein [Variovorax sp. 770b2]